MVAIKLPLESLSKCVLKVSNNTAKFPINPMRKKEPNNLSLNNLIKKSKNESII